MLNLNRFAILIIEDGAKYDNTRNMNAPVTSKTVQRGQMVKISCSIIFPEMSMISVKLWEFSPVGSSAFKRMVTRWPHFNFTEFENLGTDFTVKWNITSDFSLWFVDVDRSAVGSYRCGMMDQSHSMFDNITFLNITGKLLQSN